MTSPLPSLMFFKMVTDKTDNLTWKQLCNNKDLIKSCCYGKSHWTLSAVRCHLELFISFCLNCKVVANFLEITCSRNLKYMLAQIGTCLYFELVSFLAPGQYVYK